MAEGMVNRVPSCLAGVKSGAFTSVGWQVTLCDLIRQVTFSSCAMGFNKQLQAYTTFKGNNGRRHNELTPISWHF